MSVDDARGQGVRVPDIASPGGQELGRFATISDLHIGEPGFGIAPRVHEPRGRYRDHFTVRAARAAIDEAVAWGAELIVVKGDITWTARPGQWERAAAVLSAAPVPVVAVVGNHDVTPRGQDGRRWLEDAGVTVVVDHENVADAVDVAGMRIVLAHTSGEHHRDKGQVPRATSERVASLLSAAPDRRTMVVLHHYLSRFPKATRWPPGVDHGDALRLRQEFAAGGPPTLVTSGHTHRHRRYARDGITFTEVGSTKDYPGVWAGYVAHEGGVRQVVRRIGEPSVVEWTDTTKHACLGLWGYWTPGLLSWRCFSLPWAATRRSAPAT